MRALLLAVLAVAVAAVLVVVLNEGGRRERTTRGSPALSDAPASEPAQSPESSTATRPPPRRATLEVAVRSPAGEPVEGKRVSITRQDREVASRMTGADGIARFGERTEALLAVWIHPDPGLRLPMGDFRLREGDTRLEYVLPEPRTLVARVLVEGRVALPVRCRIAQPSLTAVTRDEVAGTIRGRFYPPGPTARVFLAAPGFLGQGADAEVACDRDPVRVDLHLRQRVRLRLIIRGEREKAAQVEVEQRTGADWDGLNGNVELGDDEGVSWWVTPGRFRVWMPAIGLVLEEFEVGETDVTHVVDLDGTYWARIAVELPDGIDDGGTRLVCETTGRSVWPHGHPTVFRVLLPRGRAVRFGAVHPLCAGRGTIDVRDEHEHVLELVAEPVLRFSFDEVESAPFPDPQSAAFGEWLRLHRTPTTVPVRLFRPNDLTKPVFEADAVRKGKGNALAIAGWRPGVYTIQLQLPRSQPVVLRGVELPAEGVDLGIVPRRRGATLAVTVDNVPDGHRARVEVVPDTLPRIVWHGRRIDGLPAGRYVVRARAGGREAEQAVALDGISARDLTLTLR